MIRRGFATAARQYRELQRAIGRWALMRAGRPSVVRRQIAQRSVGRIGGRDTVIARSAFDQARGRFEATFPDRGAKRRREAADMLEKLNDHAMRGV